MVFVVVSPLSSHLLLPLSLSLSHTRSFLNINDQSFIPLSSAMPHTKLHIPEHFFCIVSLPREICQVINAIEHKQKRPAIRIIAPMASSMPLTRKNTHFSIFRRWFCLLIFVFSCFSLSLFCCCIWAAAIVNGSVQQSLHTWNI